MSTPQAVNGSPLSRVNSAGRLKKLMEVISTELDELTTPSLDEGSSPFSATSSVSTATSTSRFDVQKLDTRLISLERDQQLAGFLLKLSNERSVRPRMNSTNSATTSLNSSINSSSAAHMSWKRRYMVLDGSGNLYMFPTSTPAAVPISYIAIDACRGYLNGQYKSFLLEVTGDSVQGKESWVLKLSSQEQMDVWVQTIQALLGSTKNVDILPQRGESFKQTVAASSRTLAVQVDEKELGGALKYAPSSPVLVQRAATISGRFSTPHNYGDGGNLFKSSPLSQDTIRETNEIEVEYVRPANPVNIQRSASMGPSSAKRQSWFNWFGSKK